MICHANILCTSVRQNQPEVASPYKQIPKPKRNSSAHCYTNAAIIRFCLENFRVSQRQAERYITAAHDQIARTAQPDRAALVGIANQRFSMLFNLATHPHTLPLALEVLKEQTRLLLDHQPARPDTRLRRAIYRVAARAPRHTNAYVTPEELRDFYDTPTAVISRWDDEQAVYPPPTPDPPA